MKFNWPWDTGICSLKHTVRDHELYLYPLLQNTLSEIQFEYWFPKQYQSVKKLDSVN